MSLTSLQRRLEALRCPTCGQPVDIVSQPATVVTDPRTGRSTMARAPIRFCPSPFHRTVFALDWAPRG